MPDGNLGAACAVILLGAIGTAWAASMRWGPSRERSWWVRTDARVLRSGPRSMDTEDLALVAIPGLSLLVVGAGFLMLPGIPAPLLLALAAAPWALALLLFAALLVSSAFLPRWVYPSWLRPLRERERQQLGSARRRS